MRKRTWKVFLLAVAMFGCASGCGQSDLAKEFRETAATSFRTGIKALADGLIDGAFAVYDPGTNGS